MSTNQKSVLSTVNQSEDGIKYTINQSEASIYLNTKCIVWSVEVDSGQLRSLNIASELSCGHGLTSLTTEPEPSLQTWTQRVGVTIVDSSSHESSDTIVTTAVQLSSSSEGCPQTLSITNLSGHSELGNNLTNQRRVLFLSTNQKRVFT